MDVQAKLIAKRYALAYMSSINNIEKARAEFLEVKKEIEPYLKYFTNPCLNSKVKNKILDKVLPQKFKNQKIENFIKLLISEKRINLLPVIAEEIEKIYQIKSGIEKVELYSKFELSQSAISEIEKLVKGLTGRKALIQKIKSDNLIAGFQLKFGDFFIDNTINSRFNAIRKSLLN